MISIRTKFRHIASSHSRTSCACNSLYEECENNEIGILDATTRYVENNDKSEELNQHGNVENVLSTIDVTHPGDEYSSYTEA